MKDFLKRLAIAALYFVVAKACLRLAFDHPSVTPVWPPTGIALFCLLMWGKNLWSSIFLGAFFANLTTLGNLYSSFGIAGGNALEALLGVYLVERYAGGKECMKTPTNIFKFALVAGFISPLTSATIGVTTLALAGYAFWQHYARIWVTWWLGDMAGSLTVAPVLLLWATPLRRRWAWAQLPELGTFIGAGLVAAWAIFFHPVYYLSIPFVVWAAFRFGEREAALTNLFFATIAIWGCLKGYGVLFQNFPYQLLLLQTFSAVANLTGLALASLVTQQVAREAADREGTERALRASEKRYHQLLQASIVGTMIVDWDGHVLDANDAFLNMLGYSRLDLENGAVGGPHMTPPEYHAMDEWTRVKLKESGVCPTVEKEYIRKDGSRIPVLVGVVFHEEPDHHLVCLVIDATDRRNAMNALRAAYDEMETRVTLRTKELAAANKDLIREIDRRKRAEAALHSLAITDALTGLYNRRGFSTLADQLLKQSRRAGRPFIFFLADLDGLKKINDTFGHLEGDHAVNAAATILKDTFRASDVVARFGGDEFAIAVIDDAQETGNQPYLERLRHKIHEFNESAHKGYAISLSVGVCSVEHSDKRPLEELIEIADKALYDEKRTKSANAKNGK